MTDPWPEPDRVSTHLGELEYRDIGAGPVLVLLHLILAAGDHWDLLVERLAPHYRCVIPDLPMGGHRLPAEPDADLSPPGIARAVAELMEALDLRDVTVIGNDTGGTLAQIIGAHHSERVGRLVLTDCDMYDEFPPRIFGYFKLVARMPGGVWLLAQSLRLRPIWRLPIAFGRLTNHIRADKIRGWGDALRASPAVRRDVRKLIRSISTDQTNDAAARLATAGLPISIVWGRDDRAFSLANAERMVQEVPGADLTVLDGCKAFVCWDQPDALAELIRERAPAPAV